MIFRDLTIANGRVHSRHIVDSGNLAPAAVALCAEMLTHLRSGEPRVEHGMEGLPRFWVGLGLSDHWPEAPGNDRFFCVGAPGLEAFQFNLVLPQSAAQEEGYYGLVTLLGISTMGARNVGATELQEQVLTLYEERPLLATSLLPVAGAEPETVMVAADFATCFAAAWLKIGGDDA